MGDTKQKSSKWDMSRQVSMPVFLAVALSLLVLAGFLARQAYVVEEEPKFANVSLETINDEKEPVEAPSAEHDPVQTADEAAIYTQGYRVEEAFIYIDFIVNANFDEVWVDFGVDPDKLNLRADYQGGGLGFDFGNGYGSFTAFVPIEQLPEGTSTYFYRIGGSIEGEEVYSGTATFNYK